MSGTEKQYGRGSGTLRVFVVEARSSYTEPQVVNGKILDGQWRPVHFDRSTVGVPVKLFSAEAESHGYLNYEAAMALAMWFSAMPMTFCLEVRLVAVDFSYSYSAKEIGVGEPMNMHDMHNAAKFTPRASSCSTEGQADKSEKI